MDLHGLLTERSPKAKAEIARNLEMGAEIGKRTRALSTHAAASQVTSDTSPLMLFRAPMSLGMIDHG
jgi:hypothetical protein